MAEVFLQVDLFGVGFCPVCSCSARMPTEFTYTCTNCGAELTVTIQALDKMANRKA